MADISRVSRLINNIHRELDLTTNTLVLENVKLNLGGANTLTFGGTLTGNRTITVPDKSFTLSDSSTFRPPGKTYFLDRDAEDISKLNLYADSGATPTDGIGGTPNITKSLNTSTSLIGSSSYRVAKDAVNRQGQGWSITTDVALDAPVVAGEPITVQFRYRTSANYASGDVRMFVYFVGPNTLQALNGISNTGVFGNNLVKSFDDRSQFTASTSCPAGTTAIRVIGHIATNFALAYDIDIDEITIGTAATLTAPIVTDWQSYTVTAANLGTGGLAITTGYWRRVGDSAEIRMFVQKDGSNGSGSSPITLSIPSGLTIDVTKINSATLTGNNFGNAVKSGGATNDLNVFYNSGTTIFLRVGSTGIALVGSQFLANEWISPVFKVPITEFRNGTNTISSTQANFLSAKAILTKAASQSLANNTGTTITFPTVVENNFSLWSVANTRVEIQETGYYELNAYIEYATNATGIRYIDFLLNGTTLLSYQQFSASSADTTALINTYYGFFNRGDFITTRGLQTSGGALNVTAGRLSARRIIDFTTVGISGAPLEVLGAASAIKTPTASGRYHEYSANSNSLTLSPGVWRLFGQVSFTFSPTSAGYNYIWARFGGANGNDTTTAPADPDTLPGVTALYGFGPAFEQAGGTIAPSTRMDVSELFLRITQTSTIFLNTYAEMTTPGNSRVQVLIRAQRIK